MRALATLTLCAALASGTVARAESTKRVKVRVVEVAGGVAYITPGSTAGLRVGTRVRFAQKTFRILAVTSKNAAVELRKKARLRIGARGHAFVKRAAAVGSVKKLAKPVALSSFDKQWPEAIRPAQTQETKTVVLGEITGASSYQLVVTASGSSLIPLQDDGDPVTRLTLGARLRAEPWSTTPLGVDLDLATSLWLGRGLDEDIGADSRPLLRVRELRLRYGSYANPMIGVGRLRYAASTVGQLDGARVSSPKLMGFTVSGFGGVVPHALSGAPDSGNTRFGAELTYENPSSSWRPWINLVAHGSRFDGAMDEKRLSSYFLLSPGPATLMGHAELSLFDSDNPWGADSVELSQAGVDAHLGTGPAHIGLRLDMRQTERSRWLESLLPPDWICTRVPEIPADPPALEPCTGADNTRYVGTLDAGIRFSKLAVTTGVTAITTADEDLEELHGFADVRVWRLPAEMRADAGFMATRSRFVDSYSLRAGAGLPLGSLELDVHYRPGVLRYKAALENLTQHRFGADLSYAASRSLDIRLAAEAVASDDINLFAAFVNAVWRPRL
jgi:hypothetical protein